MFRTQLCINTAIVYVHRFYMFHSFNKFHRNPISSCALFLAAKVEEQPRKLEHVIRVAHMILYKDQRHLDINSEVCQSGYVICGYSFNFFFIFYIQQYIEQAQELINNENILLQTLGFDVAIDHPHTQVLKCCQHLFRGRMLFMSIKQWQILYVCFTFLSVFKQGYGTDLLLHGNK